MYLCSKLRYNKDRQRSGTDAAKSKSSNNFMHSSVCSSGSRYKLPRVLLKVVIIECDVEALALLFARGRRGSFSHSLVRTGRNNSNPTALLKGLFLKLLSSSMKSKHFFYSLPVESEDHLAILCSEQDTTIQIQPRFWGNYSCDKIVTTGLLYCVTCLETEVEARMSNSLEYPAV